MTPIIAFHGSGATGQRLFRDMGSPTWNIRCPDWRRMSHSDLLALIHTTGDRVILIGYSLGGEPLQKFSGIKNVIAFVAYEAPLFDLSKRPYGEAPCLFIRNQFGRGTVNRRRAAIMERSKELWKKDRPFTEMEGNGFHIKFGSRPPYIRHGWDVELNSSIESWMNYW